MISPRGDRFCTRVVFKQRSRNFYLSNMSILNVLHESTVSDHSKTGFIFDIAPLLKKGKLRKIKHKI